LAASLKITGPAGASEVQLLDSSTWKIGREPACTVVLNDDAVSRRHAMVQQTEKDEYYLIDLGSRNGTFLNDVRVSTPSILANGDQIRVGTHSLQFQSDSALPKYVEDKGSQTDPGATRPMYAPRTVSVLVVDVRGYTKLAQAMDHTILCQLIGTWFREASQIMDKYGSWAQQYIGDAVMAVWLHDDPANRQRQMMRILRAYADFARSTQKLQQKFQLPSFRIGAGINTGLAQVGNTGTGAQTNYTAVGDAVVAAFRIETCTRQIDCDLAIGTATLEALGAPAKYFEKHSVELKGFDKPTTVWSTSFPAVEDLLATLGPESGSGRTTAPTRSA